MQPAKPTLQASPNPSVTSLMSPETSPTAAPTSSVSLHERVERKHPGLIEAIETSPMLSTVARAFDLPYWHVRRLQRDLGLLPVREVLHFRQRAQAKVPPPRREPSDDVVSRLGQVPDCAIAEETGVHAVTVAAWRRRRGIPCFRAGRPRAGREEFRVAVERLHPGLLAAAATDRTLASIGDEYGLTRERIRQIAKRVGIVRPASAPTMTPEVLARLDALLGTQTDKAVAVAVGVAVWVVARLRHARGIPRFRPSKLPVEATALLGTCFDTAIARKFGIDPNIVRHARRRRGIPPFHPSPRSPYWAKIDRSMIAASFAEGLSDVEIAAAVGGNPTWIGAIRRRELGLYRPRGGRGMRLSQERQALLDALGAIAQGKGAEQVLTVTAIPPSLRKALLAAFAAGAAAGAAKE